MFWAVKNPIEGARADIPEAKIARGSQLGATKFAPYALGIELVCRDDDGKPQMGPQCAASQDSDPLTVAAVTDGLLYYGPTPTSVPADPSTYQDRAYANNATDKLIVYRPDPETPVYFTYARTAPRVSRC